MHLVLDKMKEIFIDLFTEFSLYCKGALQNQSKQKSKRNSLLCLLCTIIIGDHFECKPKICLRLFFLGNDILMHTIIALHLPTAPADTYGLSLTNLILVSFPIQTNLM